MLELLVVLVMTLSMIAKEMKFVAPSLVMVQETLLFAG